jgi:hypothetical protein
MTGTREEGREEFFRQQAGPVQEPEVIEGRQGVGSVDLFLQLPAFKGDGFRITGSRMFFCVLEEVGKDVFPDMALKKGGREI